MEDLLTQLGLGAKEARLYIFLLTEGALPAALIAKRLKESRTNTYMILERLEKDKLIINDDTTAVRHFTAADPQMLQKILAERQQQLRQQQAALQVAMPQLVSIFNLGQHRPGVVYLEGIQGYKTLLEDIERTKTTVDILGSDSGPANEETSAMLQKATAKRKAKGISSRLIFHEGAAQWQHITTYPKRGLEVRFWGKSPLDSEVVLYGNKIAFTVYAPQLIVVVMTNDVLSQTFKTIFEQLWTNADALLV